MPRLAGNGKIIALDSSSTATDYSVLLGGCPQYSPFNQTTGNTPSQKNRTVTLKRTPVLSSTVTYVGRKASGNTTNTTPLMGFIGFAINGVAIYNDADAQLLDAYIQEGHTMDGCRGHADPSGTYHYHSEPGQGCVYTDTAGRHSPLFGVMLDSIPIYGALGDGGVAPTNLDECGGHTDTAHPFYHYHVAANLQPPYVIKCFKGCIFSANGNNASIIVGAAGSRWRALLAALPAAAALVLFRRGVA
ncbi:hypothetical protein TSOC_003776 [Tetrabaena socialis]|uniref:YHYH domain-containing protein n=1 Tax=Tetrabaena socialis TaxID=47790 RepID=A0A2J8AAP1_9CHLO|nr:hypothetical protein TSOC_003776 [Tetrabaena socialis]|eukprot:PNH09590.1 hypothetical protein TSOC_003776 [Tetrabaena socialis]